MVHVVGREVEQHGDPRMEGHLLRQLERGDLYDERVVRLARGRRERPAVVAARDRVQAGGPQARREHRGGRGLPVRPRHGELGRLGEPRAELHLPPDRQPSLVRPPQDVGGGRHTGARDHERRVIEVGWIVTAGAHVDAEPLQGIEIAAQPLARCGVREANARALGDEHPSGCDPGDPRADHQGVLPLEHGHPSPPRARKSA